jgi:hypothetical protein
MEDFGVPNRVNQDSESSHLILIMTRWIYQYQPRVIVLSLLLYHVQENFHQRLLPGGIADR